MNEIMNRRSYTRKVFDLGGGETRYQFHTAHIHYKDSNGVYSPIDTTLIQGANDWSQERASYASIFPKFADGDFGFYNGFEGADLELVSRLVSAGHVMGQDISDKEGNRILYPACLGPDIDLIAYAYHHGIKKVIKINKNPGTDIAIEFELILPSIAEFRKQGKVLERDKDHDFTGGRILFGVTEKSSFFNPALMWDSAGRKTNVPIKIINRGAKTFIRKTVPKEFLQLATFPVFTDHPTNFFSGVGDGLVNATSGVSWAGAHDAVTGAQALYTQESTDINSEVTPFPQVLIERCFFPIDTSGIGDSDTITAAVFNIYANDNSFLNTDNDGEDFVTTVQTTQASTDELVTDDYTKCGDVSNPTEGNDTGARVDYGSIVLDSYFTITLNATGLGWISKTGITKLGAREGHDVLNHALNPLSAGVGNHVNVATSEATGTSTDPFLDVTTVATGSSARMQIGNSTKASVLASTKMSVL